MTAKKNLIFIIFLIATILSFPLFSSAETIHLKDGSVIKGTIISQDEYKVTIKTSLGELKINKADIQLIEYEEKNVIIHLNDGNILKGKILSEDEQEVIIETSLGKLTISRKNILEIEIVTKMEEQLGEREKIGKEKVIQKKEKKILPEKKELEAPIIPDDRKYRKYEINLNFGLGLTQLNSSSNYFFNWNYLLLSNVQEETTTNASSKNGLFFSGSITYFLYKKFGLQSSFGYIKSDVSTNASFDFNWLWNTGEGYSMNENWSNTGNLRILPININCIIKFGNVNFEGYFSGGYTLFNNKFTANSFIGVGATYYYYYWVGYRRYLTQYVDALKVPANITESWTAHGMNFGGGADLIFTENIGISADLRYYICPSKELHWKLTEGTYTGHFFGDFSVLFDSTAAKIYGDSISSLKVNPSFFQLSVGIKFFF